MAESGADICGSEFSACAQLSTDGTAPEDAILKQLIAHTTPGTTYDVVVYYRGIAPLSDLTTLTCEFGAGATLSIVTWTSADIP